jgi:hypothetical protein|tara:strand:+ start:4568 stop:5749 length:1182 start_codon:yes stop_codon:yes gene_type:complete
MKKVEYLIGNKHFKFISSPIYNSLVCDFICDLSKVLLQHANYKKYPDIITLAFWCRKQNIDIMKRNFSANELRVGLGLVFHITPSNVPTNFAYSLLFGLLTGNSNIIKVPSKKFEQINIICDCIKKILKKKKYIQIKNKITIVRYNNFDEFTDKISSICDARLIWGGNKSIKEIRKFTLNPRSRDIAFSDRFSLCAINAQSILELDQSGLNRVVEKFYNDTYLVDQNACSSPHLIVWLGNKGSKAKNIFWQKLYKYTLKKYTLPKIASIDKYTKLCEDLINLPNIKSHKNYTNLLHVVTLKNLDFNINKLRGKWGYFYEYNSKNLDYIAKFIDQSCQTLTYIGISKDILKKFVVKNNLKGIDRIVPTGQGLSMSLNWDGYNINQALSRIIDLK